MKKQITLLVSFLPLFVFSQIGGNHVYEFLTVPTSARSSALGGSAISINDGDITLANENPALFTSATSGKLALEYINYISDINFGQTSYAHNIKNVGTLGFGVQYMNGGDFTWADENGNQLGNFSAKELAVKLTYAKSFDSVFSIGATVKPVYSHLEQYKSFGILMDVGGAYTSTKGLFTAALVFKNFGSQITTYVDDYEPMPFNIQAGVSQKLEHAPFRFSIIAHSIQKPRLSYSKENNPEPSNVEVVANNEDDASFLEDVMRHMIFGVEFVPSKSFFVRGGLNYQRRQELKLDEKPGMTGFTWGFGFRIAKLHFSYANARYHAAGASNHFTITTRLSDYFN